MEPKVTHGGPMPLFPDAVVVMLRELRLDPDARPAFDPISGSLVWPDEGLRELGPSHWPLFAYRASLILDQPDHGLEMWWTELRQRCPTWPGFRRERRAKSLRPLLDQYLAGS